MFDSWDDSFVECNFLMSLLFQVLVCSRNKRKVLMCYGDKFSELLRKKLVLLDLWIRCRFRMRNPNLKSQLLLEWDFFC